MEENKKPRSTGRVHRRRQSTGKLWNSKWKYAIDLFMEFEIALLGNHEAICQTSTKVSKLEMQQPKARVKKSIQWQWNRKMGLSY